jgi:hypothetical protein
VKKSLETKPQLIQISAAWNSCEGCIFTCRGGWTLAYARQRELIEVLESGNGLLSRLDGEWCLNPGG